MELLEKIYLSKTEITFVSMHNVALQKCMTPILTYRIDKRYCFSSIMPHVTLMCSATYIHILHCMNLIWQVYETFSPSIETLGWCLIRVIICNCTSFHSTLFTLYTVIVRGSCRGFLVRFVLLNLLFSVSPFQKSAGKIAK